MIRVHPACAGQRLYDVAIGAYHNGLHLAQDRRGNAVLAPGQHDGQYKAARTFRDQHHARITLLTPRAPEPAA